MIGQAFCISLGYVERWKDQNKILLECNYWDEWMPAHKNYNTCVRICKDVYSRIHKSRFKKYGYPFNWMRSNLER